MAISSILANNFHLLAFIAYFRSFQEINLAFETFFVKFLSILATSSTLNVRTNEFCQYFNCIHKHRSRFCQVVPLLAWSAGARGLPRRGLSPRLSLRPRPQGYTSAEVGNFFLPTFLPTVFFWGGG